MRMTFDREANAAYIFLEEASRQSRSVENVVVERDGKGDIVLDFDADGRLLGIEIIGAAELVDGSVLAAAEQL
jgi:uncharacterized protein YuzE